MTDYSDLAMMARREAARADKMDEPDLGWVDDVQDILRASANAIEALQQRAEKAEAEFKVTRDLADTAIRALEAAEHNFEVARRRAEGRETG